MSFLLRPTCWMIGHTWRWITLRTQECATCGATREVA